MKGSDKMYKITKKNLIEAHKRRKEFEKTINHDNNEEYNKVLLEQFEDTRIYRQMACACVNNSNYIDEMNKELRKQESICKDCQSLEFYDFYFCGHEKYEEYQPNDNLDVLIDAPKTECEGFKYRKEEFWG